jgi:hypothetical protein
MNQEAIFAPMFAMVWVTLAVWVYLFCKRLPFIRSLQLKPNDLTPGELSRRAPSSVTTPSDNLKNLFELPVLFYAVTLYLFVTGRVDGVYLWAAWIFVAARALHSIIHCTYNDVSQRFFAYLISCAALFFMIMRASLAVFLG